MPSLMWFIYCLSILIAPSQRTNRSSTMSSSAAVSAATGFADVGLCMKCGQVPTFLSGPLPRHMVPCGHLVCGPCEELLKAPQPLVELDEKDEHSRARSVICPCSSCRQHLLADEEWPVAFCIARRERAHLQLVAALADQGDAGDGSASPATPDAGQVERPEGASAAAGSVAMSYATAGAASGPVTASSAAAAERVYGHAGSIGGYDDEDPRGGEHDGEEEESKDGNVANDGGKIDGKGKDKCDSAAGVRPSRKMQAALELDEGLDLCPFPYHPALFLLQLRRWEGQELARIDAWEERVLARTRRFAGEMRERIGVLVNQRLQAGSDLHAQRRALQASIQDMDAVIAKGDEPDRHVPAATWSLARAERAKLQRLLESRRMGLPQVEDVRSWLSLGTFKHLRDVGTAIDVRAYRSMQEMLSNMGRPTPRFLHLELNPVSE